MAQHARLAASQTKQWAICAGWVAIMESRPELEQPSGWQAQMGTCAHALVERCLSEGSEPVDYAGRFIEIIENVDGEGTSILRKGAKRPNTTRIFFEVDEDMVDATTIMTDYVRRRLDELGLTMASVRLEQRINPLPHRDDTGGTADVIIDAWPEIIEAIDYKNGDRVFVPVEGNMQLRSYGLGAAVDNLRDYEKIQYTIVQPRSFDAKAHSENGIMTEEITPAELGAWGEWLSGRADAVDDARAMVATGATMQEMANVNLLSVGKDGSHCRYCELVAGCPATLAKAQELAMVDFDNEPGGIPPPHMDGIVKLLPWAPFLKALADTVAEEALRVMLGGYEVEGWKIVRKKSPGRKFRKTIIGEDDEEVELTADLIAEIMYWEFGLKSYEIYTDPTPALRTGPQIEKLIKGNEEKRRYSDMLLLRAEGSLTIAPEDDQRSAVVLDPGADFDDEEE